MNDLIGSQHVCRGDTGAGSANIHGFREFYEIYAGRVLASKEDGDLEPNSGKPTLF